MLNKVILLLLLFSTVSTLSLAQQDRKAVRKGNKAYKDGNFETAAESYRQGVEENIYSYEANFNLGDALYQQGEFESAAQQFNLIGQTGDDKAKVARAYHNLGNSYLEQQKYAESVEAFKEALRNNPADEDTRYNLVYAMEKLKEQQQQQNQDQNQNQENQDQENQDQENQDQQDQNQQNQEEENQQDQQNQEPQQEGEQNQEQQEQQQNQQQQGQEEQNQQQEQQQQQGAQPKEGISKQEAQRILQALQLDEQQLHDKMKKKKIPGKRSRVLKDW